MIGEMEQEPFRTHPIATDQCNQGKYPNSMSEGRGQVVGLAVVKASCQERILFPHKK
jgi:hypothetical protein